MILQQRSIDGGNGYFLDFDNDYKPILDGLQIPSKNILRMGKTSKNEFWAYFCTRTVLHSNGRTSA
jgi:hypothetical protein